MSKRKLLTMIGIVTMLLLVTGCSDSKTNQEKNSQGTETETKETNKLESDVDLTKQLEAEKGIAKVMVQTVEGAKPSVNVDIEINNEQTLSADEVVTKYGEVIKKKYPDRPIDIIVAKEGKLLKQVTLPK